MIGVYSILRTKKHKSLAAVARSARHTFRQQPTPNADPARRNQNRVVGATSYQKLVHALNDQLPEKRRRDAVLCIEYLITASPESFRRHGGHLDDLGNGYFQDALNWLRQRHGSKHVLCAAIHLDELTPHLVAYVVPLTNDGRLSARDFLGGPKTMTAMQDSFHSVCGAPRGLMRGTKGSKAKHSEISSYYSALTLAGEAPQLRSIDYAAKAMGFETSAWKQAERVAMTHAHETAISVRHRKEQTARAKQQERDAQAMASATSDLKQQQAALAQREQSVSEREIVLSHQLPALQIAQAKIETLERLLDQQRAALAHSSAEPKNITPEIIGSINIRRRTRPEYEMTS